MSDPDQPPAASRKRLGTGAVIGLVLTLGLVGGIGGTWLRGTDDGGPSYPSAWDPRVQTLVTYVEEHRGLTFKHPVYVEFLSDADFVKEVVTPDGSLSAKDKEDIAHTAALMRAFGLLSGNADLLKAQNALEGSDIIGLYSNDDKRIRVRGDQLTPSVKVTLVHELTHALQDQYFDLNATFTRLDEDKTSDSYAFHAIVEGDAVRIANGYREAQSAADQAAIRQQDEKDQTRATAGASSVPEFLQATFAAAYPLGEYAVRSSYAMGGNAGVDRLFSSPPLHDSLIMDPYLIDHPLPLPPIPDLALNAGEKEVDRGTFGSFELYLLLAKQTPYARAVNVAEGDLNDRYLQYSAGGRACVRAEFATRGPAWSANLRDALTRWAGASHTGAAVTQTGTLVTLKSCDPGPHYVPSPDHSNDALHVLIERNAVYSILRGDTVPPGFAICYADGVMKRFSLADFERLDAGGTTATDRMAERAVAVSCPSGQV